MTNRRRELALAACLAFVILGHAFDLAGYPLIEPDEGRNAEVMREMAESNDYLLPRLNGFPYLDKPVLYFAIGAGIMELLGPTVLAARLPSFLFTLATLAVVARFAARLGNRDSAWIAVIATAATPFALAYARTVIFDSTLTFFVVLAVMGWYEAIEHDRNPAAERAWGWRLLAWTAIALGVLTKGPIALALPLMIVIPYSVWRRRTRALVDATSLLAFLALVLPWVYAVSRDVPDFLHYVLVTETFERLTTPNLERTEAIWYFLVILPAAALPWSVVVLGGVLSRVKRRLASGAGTPWHPRDVLLTSWMLVPLLFFTLSQSKRPQYILPLIPAVGLAVAGLWHDGRRRLPGIPTAAAVLAAFGITLAAVRHAIASWVPATPAVAAEIPPTAAVLGITCVVAAWGAWFGRARRALALLSLSLPVVAIPVVSTELMDEIAASRSAVDVAVAVERVADPPPRIVAVHSFPLSLPFYLRRRILVSTDDGAVFTSNYLASRFDRYRRMPEAPVRPGSWWREALLGCPRPLVFVLKSDDTARRRQLEGQLALLVDTGRYVAYGPCGQRGLAALPITSRSFPSPPWRERVHGEEGT